MMGQSLVDVRTQITGLSSLLKRALGFWKSLSIHMVSLKAMTALMDGILDKIASGDLKYWYFSVLFLVFLCMHSFYRSLSFLFLRLCCRYVRMPRPMESTETEGLECPAGRQLVHSSKLTLWDTRSISILSFSFGPIMIGFIPVCYALICSIAAVVVVITQV